MGEKKLTEGSSVCFCDHFRGLSNCHREGPVSFLCPSASQQRADQAVSRCSCVGVDEAELVGMPEASAEKHGAR
jgi:hypothetical protein